MKRRIVRITAGALIVLAWLAAGVYAFWGPKKDDATPPKIDAERMSQQIAAANLSKPQPSAVTPAVAMEDSPAPAAKPAPNPLFSPSKATSGSSFKPRSTFQPSTSPPAANVATSAYGAAPARSAYGEAPSTDVSIPVEDEGLQPMPEGPVAEAGVDAAPPSRYTPKSLSVAGDAETETTNTDADAAENAEAPLAPPPSRFGNVDVAADSAAPPPMSTFGGTRRFGNNVPQNELPAESAPQGLAQEDAGYGAPPSASPLGATRFNNTGIANTGISGQRDPIPAAGDNALPVAVDSVASARPGQTGFEGTQAPSLVIEKLAPAEIQVGKPARFEIHVRNAGQTAAQQVVVTDHVPAGTQLIEAKPQATQGENGLLMWQLGKLEPGEDKSITIELMPQQEGEIGSVAQVTFAAAASVKTVCTKPMLVVEQIAPTKVMIGETVTLQITISNPGTGAATGVVLQEDVPEGLAHSAGKELEYEVGTLRPGETRKLELQLEAAKAGLVQNKLVVRGDASLIAEHTAQIEVVAPQLAVEMNGPKRRYLDRQATYTVSIANPGTAAARDIEIVAYLPKGMKFVSTDKEGQYDPQNHAVYWSLEELPADQQGSAQLVTIPIEAGEQKLRVEGHAQQNLRSEDEEVIVVEAIPQLVFEIVDEADPIEVGADTVYQIRVTNEGSKAATNVQVAAALPAELKPVAADGATRGEVQGQTVIFEPLGKLAPQAEAIFKVQATGMRTGDYTIRVQVTSDDLQTPVTKEEPTRVYADR